MTRLDDMMLRWYRGKATVGETQELIAAKYVRVTNKTYGHVAATAKGNAGFNRAYNLLNAGGISTEQIDAMARVIR